jgi:hypothetical protein
MRDVEAFQNKGSNWTVDRIEHFDLHILEANTLRASAYLPLPEQLQYSQSLVNVENHEDSFCILWSILATRHHQTAGNPKDPQEYRQYLNTLNRGDLEFPIELKDVPKLETLNKLRINLFGYDKENSTLFPIYISEASDERELVEVLYYDDGVTGHFVAITNFDTLARSCRHNNYGGSWYFFCRRCLTGFQYSQQRDQHSLDCGELIRNILFTQTRMTAGCNSNPPIFNTDCHMLFTQTLNPA